MIVLGSTGSIGVNTLAIAAQFDLSIEGLVAGRNIELLNAQIAQHRPKWVVIADPALRAKVHHPHVGVGEEAILEMIEQSSSPMVVNALVGFAGFRPTLHALACGKQVALANKESLVVGGAFVDTSRIVPIDSEHFGLWYLQSDRCAIERMVITASGGALRDWPIEQIEKATLVEVLKHPNWSMGTKITIDSASMVNKLFELIEARWLFGEGEYDALIETQSLIHALIEYADGSSVAHLAHADMRLPIAFALLGRVDLPLVPRIDLAQIAQLSFRPIARERYPIWELKEEILTHPQRGVIINAANEVAIERFVAGAIPFGAIATTILQTYEHFTQTPQSLEEIFAIDHAVRMYVRERR